MKRRKKKKNSKSPKQYQPLEEPTSFKPTIEPIHASNGSTTLCPKPDRRSRSRGTKTRKSSKRAALRTRTSTHTHTVSLILARVWNAIRNAIRGLARERGQRKDMIRTRAEVQTCRVFPLVAGHRPTPPDTASPAVYVPDYITIPLLLFDKPIVMLSRIYA